MVSHPSQPYLLFTNEQKWALSPGTFPVRMEGDAPYVLIRSEGRKWVLNARGEEVFSGNYEDVKMFTDTLFRVSNRGRYGLISASGHEVLPIEYSFVSMDDRMVQTLKSGKIGGLDLENNVFFPPRYEEKILSLGRYYKTRWQGAYGLIDENENTVLPFRFDDIMPWSDSLFWVQQGDRYSLVKPGQQDDAIMEVELLSSLSNDNPRLYTYYSGRGFGLMSNVLGQILGPNFTHLRWLRNPEDGILVGEQSLPDSGFLIISYFHDDGRKIGAYAYPEEDIDNVICNE
jgi:hypothetical protein